MKRIASSSGLPPAKTIRRSCRPFALAVFFFCAILAARICHAGPTLGDVNADGRIDLKDAVVAFQAGGGMSSGSPVSLESDIDGDGRVGTPEAIFALQICAGTRRDAGTDPQTGLKHSDIHYTLGVTPGNQTVRVDMRINEPVSGEITLTPGYALRDRDYSLQVVEARTMDGEELSAAAEGIGWNVHAPSASRVEIRYLVTPPPSGDGEHYTYVAENFASLTGDYLLTPTLSGSGAISDDISLSFNMPREWEPFVPWLKNGEFVRLDKNSSVPVGEQLVRTAFLLGDFRVLSRDINGTDVHMVMSSRMPDSEIQAVAEDCFSSFEETVDFWGTTLTDDYWTFFSPDPGDGRPVAGPEYTMSQEVPYFQALDFTESYIFRFAHQTFHRWNAWALGMDYDHSSTKWFIEGPTVYHESVSAAYAGHAAGAEERIGDYYQEYKNALGTDKDKALSSIGSSNWDNFIVYKKAPLAAALIAREIYARTNGTATMSDFFRTLFSQYGYHQGVIDNQVIQQELKEFTGTSFETFFADYIHGQKALPLDWIDSDTDGDGASDLLEVMSETDWNSTSEAP